MRRFAEFAVALVLLHCASGCTKESASQSAASPGAAPAAVAQAENPASSSDGARVYITNCSSCHQRDGRGVPGAFPPLAANAIVTGPAPGVIAIVKLGMSGKIHVAGERYDGTMPHWGQLISDDDIAAVVTYIRSAWHNRAAPVSVADVKAVSR